MIGNTPEDAIERFRMRFLNDTRSCIVAKDIPEVTIAGVKIGPFSLAFR